jgi:hypothetical protein
MAVYVDLIWYVGSTTFTSAGYLSEITAAFAVPGTANINTQYNNVNCIANFFVGSGQGGSKLTGTYKYHPKLVVEGLTRRRSEKDANIYGKTLYVGVSPRQNDFYS